MAEPTGATTRIPGFRDLSVIGRGASSTVYRANDAELARPVAIKVLLADDPEDPATRRFKREGVITANLGRHPHIVQVLGTGFTEDGHPYVVMELFEQGSIADRLRALGTFPVDETLDVGAKIADAVSAAHRAGVLHRDIKPQNVLLSEYGPALADFGIARTTANLEWSQSLDQLTPMHAAPEVLSGGTSTVQSDIYSLGSTLYTMLSGRPPFAGPPGEAPLRYQLRVLQEPMPPIARSDVGGAMLEVLERTLAKSPADRFRSASELHDSLDALLRARRAQAADVRRGGSATWLEPVGEPRPPPATPPGAPAGVLHEDNTVTRSSSLTDSTSAEGSTQPQGAGEDASTVWPRESVPSFLSLGSSPASAPGPDPGTPLEGQEKSARPFRGLEAVTAPGADHHQQDSPQPSVDILLGDASRGAIDPVTADGEVTVHRPLGVLATSGPPEVTADHPGRKRRWILVSVVAVTVVVTGATVGAVALLSHQPLRVKNTRSVTTTATDKPENLSLTATSKGATLRWASSSASALRYLVIEVTPRGDKVLATTAAGATSLTVAGVDPATTSDCFEVTAVLSTRSVGAPAHWCPTGESLASG